MSKCKFCNSENIVRNGNIRRKQRYKCKDCKKSYTEGDGRVSDNKIAQSIALILYSTGKSSYRFIARLLNLSPATIYNWLKKLANTYLPEDKNSKYEEIEIDEMWHFIQKKVTNAGYSKQWIEKQENVLRMLLEKETFRQYINSLRR
jgi:transposase-like protein